MQNLTIGQKVITVFGIATYKGMYRSYGRVANFRLNTMRPDGRINVSLDLNSVSELKQKAK